MAKAKVKKKLTITIDAEEAETILKEAVAKKFNLRSTVDLKLKFDIDHAIVNSTYHDQRDPPEYKYFVTSVTVIQEE
jgi:hypothetical protein